LEGERGELALEGAMVKVKVKVHVKLTL